jgi:hypothetical protein
MICPSLSPMGMWLEAAEPPPDGSRYALKQISSPLGGRPVLSETNIVQHIQKLEDIGYRVIGTDEAVLGEVLCNVSVPDEDNWN